MEGLELRKDLPNLDECLKASKTIYEKAIDDWEKKDIEQFLKDMEEFSKDGAKCWSVLNEDTEYFKKIMKLFNRENVEKTILSALI